MMKSGDVDPIVSSDGWRKILGLPMIRGRVFEAMQQGMIFVDDDIQHQSWPPKHRHLTGPISILALVFLFFGRVCRPPESPPTAEADKKKTSEFTFKASNSIQSLIFSTKEKASRPNNNGQKTRLGNGPVGA